MDQATASVFLVRGLSEVVAAAGVDPGRFLREAKLDEGALNAAPGRRLPYLYIANMIELALDMTGDEALGMRWVSTPTQRSFGPLEHLLMHVPALREAMQLLARYFHLFSDRRAYAVLERGPRLLLRYVPIAGESTRARRFVSEMVIGGFWRFFRFYDPRAALGPVAFSYGAPPHRDLYERVFEGRVSFDQPFTALELDARLLDTPSPQRDDELRDTLLGLVEQRLTRLDHNTPLSRRVVELLGQEDANRRTMESVARVLRVSVRTLRRQLTAEGAGFDELRAEAQCRRAKALLRDPDKTIQEVAFDLGFAHVSTFHRAFKRWSGTTPGAYRTEHLREHAEAGPTT